MRNKKANIAITIISMIFFLIIGLTTANFVINEVTQATSDLNCSSASTISDGNKLLCLATDSTVVYYIYMVFAVIIGAFISRLFL